MYLKIWKNEDIKLYYAKKDKNTKERVVKLIQDK